jgi:hypothetical protein
MMGKISWRCNAVRLKMSLSQIDWRKYLQHNFADVTDQTQVLVTDVDYVSNVSLLIDLTDEMYAFVMEIFQCMLR